MPLKKSLTRIIKFFGIGFTVLYPFIVFFALKKRVALRVLALLLLTAAGFSFARNRNIWIFICVLLFGVGLIVFNDDIFLKLYPVLMNISVCLVFALSLRETPLVEQFAEKMGHKLDAVQKEYTRRVTYAWATFMFFLAIASMITVFLSDEIWTLFNGLISYILIAIMMGTEFIIRKRVMNARRDK